MKVRVYKVKTGVRPIYILTPVDSFYSQLVGEKRPYRTTKIPKRVYRAFSKCIPDDRLKMAKTFYKGLK